MNRLQTNPYWQRLKAYLAPPTFPHDTKKTHTAAILNTMLWGIVIVLSLYCFSRFVATYPDIFDSAINRLLITLIIVIIPLIPLLKKGYVNTTSYLLIFLTWSILSFQAATNNGLFDSAYIALFVNILIASLLLGWRATLTFTIATILVGWGIAWRQVTGAITLDFYSPYLVIQELSIIFLLANFLIYLLITTLNRALFASQQSNAKLQLLTQSMETEIETRTQIAEHARHEAEKAREEAEFAQQAVIEQMWLVSGQARLNDRLQGELDTSTAANIICEYICQYLEIPVAALFHHHNGNFHLAGSYAYSLEQTPPPFPLGHGLIGQVALNQKPQILDQFPPNHLTIQTSIGTIYPQQLYLQPLIYQANTVAVLELALLKPITNKQRSFLQSIHTTLAITIHTTHTRARIDQLLHDAQQQAEELLTQEEELRLTNEELRLQTEKWRRAEANWRAERNQLQTELNELRST
ncbi:MAG TPA: GAF domain-containing protein [Anaerolineae bacterium]|nr:GAF domain-containing protein [Anaerolineae bacterium]